MNVSSVWPEGSSAFAGFNRGDPGGLAVLRRKGRPVPTNDLRIAAVAMPHGYGEFSLDGHFAEMEGVIAGSRLDDFLP